MVENLLLFQIAWRLLATSSQMQTFGAISQAKVAT